MLKTSCVYQGAFDPRENKTVIDEDLHRVACPVEANRLIVSRMNTPDLVGSAGLTTENAETLFLPDRLWQVTFRDSEPSFVYWWTRTQLYRDQVRSVCAGTSSSMQNLSLAEFRALMLPLPPLEEQRAIAGFLDRETGKIDALVEEQRRLIALLREKRQAVISLAVTKGLDPAAPLKPSGIDWLGDIPAHWLVAPLKHLTAPGRDIMYGIVLPGPHVDGGVPIVKGGDVKGHRLRVDLLNRTTAEIEASFARARLKPNDVVYSIRGTIGDAELVPPELENANITQDVARISPGPEIDHLWLLFVMRSSPVFVQLEQRSLGAAVRGINIYDLKRARIPVPPSEERLAIGLFIQRETSKLDALISEAETAIDLLQERRSALISSAVTGKIDVREAGADATEAA